MEDLLIRGGRVIDGTGAPAREADVAVTAGRIVEVAPGSARKGKREIDARGQVVAPGLIDIHTHSDYTLPVNPRAESKIRQGVTTEVVGNCGFSAAPALPGTAAMLKEYLAASAPWLPIFDTNFKDYLDNYPATSVNVVHQVGHNTLRLMTVGMERRAATAEEMQAMVTLLEEALAAGALGLSSGLFTAPGSNASAEEIHTLARVLHRHGARYSTHVRDEGNHLFDAVREAIAVARETGVHTQIAHLKLSGMDNWGGAARLLGEIDAARREGVPVDCDQYPYDTGTNPLRNLLPSWVQEGGVGAMLERLKQQAVRERLRTDIARDGLNNFGRISGWDAVRVAISASAPETAGKTIGELARERRQDAFDQVCDCIVADRGHTRILITSMAEEDVRAITGTPWILVASDGNSLAVEGVTSEGMPHPRFYGTHARVLGACVRDMNLLTLEQAVHKMTGGSATALGWTERGWLKAGQWADVTVFDPARIADVATYEKPHQYATGVSTVVVNGEVVIDGGEHTGALPGRVIRRNTVH
ncbi:MAG: D-aminoacylase [Usitatibacter sp.]